MILVIFLCENYNPLKRSTAPFPATPPIQQKNKGRCTLCTSGTSVYCKPTFSEVYTHFDSFLPSTYKLMCTHSLIDASEPAQVGRNYTLN